MLAKQAGSDEKKAQIRQLSRTAPAISKATAHPSQDIFGQRNTCQSKPDAQSPTSLAAPALSFETAASQDCETPHHSMLPAPGANMLSEACQAKHMSSLRVRGPCSGPDDPIIATTGQGKCQADKSMPARRKPGIKTWNTLNLQQAPHAQPSMLVQGSTATADAVLPHSALQQQQLLYSARWDNGGEAQAQLQQDKHQCSAQTQSSQGGLSAAAAASRLPSAPTWKAPQHHSAAHALHPSQAGSKGSQLCEAATAAGAAQACMISEQVLEGSETQPDLQYVQVADHTAPFGTPCAVAQRHSETGLVINSQTGARPCQAAAFDAADASPACQNIPDSAGNPSAPSQQHLQRVSQASSAFGGQDTSHADICIVQDEQGWRAQLHGPIVALAAHGR